MSAGVGGLISLLALCVGVLPRGVLSSGFCAFLLSLGGFPAHPRQASTSCLKLASIPIARNLLLGGGNVGGNGGGNVGGNGGGNTRVASFGRRHACYACMPPRGPTNPNPVRPA